MCATACTRGWYRFIVYTLASCGLVAGGKGNFNQTARSIRLKLEKNIRFLIETTLPKMYRTRRYVSVHLRTLKHLKICLSNSEAQSTHVKIPYRNRIIFYKHKLALINRCIVQCHKRRWVRDLWKRRRIVIIRFMHGLCNTEVVVLPRQAINCRKVFKYLRKYSAPGRYSADHQCLRGLYQLYCPVKIWMVKF